MFTKLSSDSTGLKVNYNKSMMVPININDERLDLLARIFGCSKGSLPFTYLGLPLGTTKPRIQDFLPLVNKCERRLGGISTLLNQAGRLQMTNGVLSSLPTFYMCTLELPKAVIKQIDKFRKNCLWRGSNINGRGAPKAAWEIVCKTKEKGGLGVINLHLQNQALLMKNLDNFFNKKDIPWVHLVWEKHYSNGRLPSNIKKGSFWWRDNLKLLQNFKEMTTIQIKDGQTCLFWKDKWLPNILEHQFPQLSSFAKRKTISVSKALTMNSASLLLNLPITQEAYSQLNDLLQIISGTTLVDENDSWFINGRSKGFSSAAAYRMLLGQHNTEPIYRWIWKSHCQPKHKVFCWLLVKDRLSARNILRRKHMNLESYNCEICSQRVEETVEHLFWDCAFARQCWAFINVQTIQGGSSIQNVAAARIQLQSQFFMTTTIVLLWTIWKVRNKLIFNNNQIGLQECKAMFLQELGLISLRIKKSLTESFQQWIQRLQ